MFDDLKAKYELARAYQANQAQTIIGAGIIGIAILVIVLVYSQVEQSLPTPTNAELAGASTNVTSTFAASMDNFWAVPFIVFNPSLKTPDSARIHETCSRYLDSTCSFCNLVSS